MPILNLTADTRAELSDWLHSDTLLVACLCAAWCDVCCDYRATFEQLAAQNPDSHFVWIDIEDQADLIGDIEVDNFPTLLMQRGPTVTFFGSVPPGQQVTHRLIQSQREQSTAQCAADALSSTQRRLWQTQCHLARRLGMD